MALRLLADLVVYRWPGALNSTNLSGRNSKYGRPFGAGSLSAALRASSRVFFQCRSVGYTDQTLRPHKTRRGAASNTSLADKFDNCGLSAVLETGLPDKKFQLGIGHGLKSPRRACPRQ
jgi:hypothetical protein